MHLKGSQVKFLNFIIFLSPKKMFLSQQAVQTNDEKPHYVALHLDPHYLPEYPFRIFQYTKGPILSWRLVMK